MAQEVAPFGIEFTLAEPGPTPTNFAAGLDMAPALPDYADTPSGAVRRAIADGSFTLSGDPDRMAALMLDAAGQSPAPRRITLGSHAYRSVHAALTERLARLEAQEALARSADLPG